MPDTLTNITTLINSPPGVLVAGGVLAGIVWKFFERVEAVLTDDTKLEIAVWLLGRKKFGPRVQPWPNTFAKVFETVFGTKLVSFRCILLSGLATFVSSALCLIVLFRHFHLVANANVAQFLTTAALTTALILFAFDYLSLLETRFILNRMCCSSKATVLLLLLVGDAVATGITGAVPTVIGNVGFTLHPFRELKKQRQLKDSFYHDLQVLAELSYNQSGDASDERLGRLDAVIRHIDSLSKVEVDLAVAAPFKAFIQNQVQKWPYDYASPEAYAIELRDVRNSQMALDDFEVLSLWLPGFFTSIWLWLYAGSGFLLKVARRFDIGFQWFNRRFDIEKKPLQSIGLVAGALVAVVYWAGVIVSRVL